jgi:Ni,Fe-hydrogenase III small subunit
MTLWPRLAKNLLGTPLTDPAPAVDDATVAALVERLEASSRARLGRSLWIRHVPSGGCNACELEIHALQNVVHDLERLGLRFVASPRHADVLLVTGPMTRNLRAAVERCRLATPEPVWVVAAGDCAVDGGVFQASPAVERGGASAALEVDLLIPGCPPTPAQFLRALAALVAANRNPRPRPVRASTSAG